MFSVVVRPRKASYLYQLRFADGLQIRQTDLEFLPSRLSNAEKYADNLRNIKDWDRQWPR
jgi:hypothetical protein